MQNVSQEAATDNPNIDKVVNVHHCSNLSSTPQSTSNSSPTKSETETYSEHRRFMSDTSASEEDSVSEDSAISFEDEKIINKLLEEVTVEVESFMIDQEDQYEEDTQVVAAKYLLNPDNEDRGPVDPETQARLEALLQAAGISQLAGRDGKHLADPEVLRRLTSSVSCALDEAAAALTRMRSENPRSSQQSTEKTSLVEACTDGDVGTVRKLLTEGRSVHETSEEGESLLSLACSAGYYELAQVLLAMHANVEDRGIKGECTPLMEAASAGHLEIVRLLVKHGADVNAQSTSGNTPLMYGCAGGHTEVVKFLLENGANVEDHNENGHTPLMEAASAGHVGLAKILLEKGAGINTHSNEFKESALTLACYKGHLEMVRFLLEAGADQEHKTDEMHTALMEASMDGHVEVARLLLDSGAQVNMPTDSFESPLTLAACGGHVDLAMLLIERGANIEEVNDEGYTPLMEAAREGHEEMVHLLLGQGANINAQTDETQETALTLACCGGFTEVADILLKGGADIELGASTPLMEAAQEGHLDLVRFLLENNAHVHAQTQTGDTALTYACENGHTDVADLLLQYYADLEHESEGGRTPLMKACRAGHLCTVQFLISKGADVRRQTTNNDHTPLSLACAGGHLAVVELLLAHNADPCHKLKDNSTMLIEAAKGGHTNVVQLLLDYPHPMLINQHPQTAGVVGATGPIPGGNAQVAAAAAAAAAATAATNLAMLPGQVGNGGGSSRESPPALPSTQSINFFQPPPASAVLQEVPEAVRIVSHDEPSSPTLDVTKQKSLLTRSRSTGAVFDGTSLTSAEAQQVRTQPLPLPMNDIEEDAFEFLSKEDPNSSLVEFIKSRKCTVVSTSSSSSNSDEGTTQKQQILEELHRVERELHGKQQSSSHVFQYAIPQDPSSLNASTPPSLPHTLNLDIAMQQQGLGTGMSGSIFPANNLQGPNAFYTTGGVTSSTSPATCLQQSPLKIAVSGDGTSATATGTSSASGGFTNNSNQQQQPPAFYFTPLSTSATTVTTTALASTATTTSAAAVSTTTATSQPIKFQNVTSPPHAEVSQNTAISDRPKAKPVSKKEGKNVRKQQHPQQVQQNFQSILYSPQPAQVFGPIQLQQQQQQQQQQQATSEKSLNNITDTINLQGLDLDSIDHDSLVLKEDNTTENLLTASILHQFQNTNMKSGGGTPVQPYPGGIDESMLATFSCQQEMKNQSDISLVEYFAVPSSGTQVPGAQVPVHTLYPYEHYLAATGGITNKEQSGPAIYQAGFQAGINLMQQQLACPNNASSSDTTTLTTSTSVVVPTSVGVLPGPSSTTPPATVSQQQYVSASPVSPLQQQATSTSHCVTPTCTQHTHQVQAATQTPQPTNNNNNQVKKPAQNNNNNSIASNVVVAKTGGSGEKAKKVRFGRHQNANFDPTIFHQNQPLQLISQNNHGAINQYNGGNNAQQQQQCQNAIPCLDVDSKTDSNHDTALTLACAGGHDDLVELLINRGADIEHRDKKGFTPLILAATAGHEKVVEVLLNHTADIEAQSERTKDTPLSLACSGGRYEVVELLLTRNANKEHRNVSDYTPLSLAASGGYVNIIKLLLHHGAEINSRTGSKLGISPLMLAAMNGHTAAVKLLLDMGSDINAQIETNRNTALTLACFQGRHEVVSLLLDRKANVEHRAKTGLTPLMEAASGGYVEVGRVLLDKNADVNATPVPSSRDTALTIAADKGHVRFVELLLQRGAQIEVKNKKGNSPLWLAANGGHLAVVELLFKVNADIDSQDNRKVSCLMAAFRKGHTKVVKWMVHHVTQFPSDQEMIRYISTVSDKELLEKCQDCVKIIRAAKETQAAKANKNATILLEELDMEKNREENKRLAAARRRERKKKKKLEKKEERRKLLEENKKNENYDESSDKKLNEEDKEEEEDNIADNIDAVNRDGVDGEGDSGIDANSQGSCSSNDIKTNENKRKDKKKKKNQSGNVGSSGVSASKSNNNSPKAGSSKSNQKEQQSKQTIDEERLDKRAATTSTNDKSTSDNISSNNSKKSARKSMVFEASTKSPADRDDFEATGNENYISNAKSNKKSYENDSAAVANSGKSSGSNVSPKQPSSSSSASKREDGWKEVVRKSSVQTVSTTSTTNNANVSESASGLRKVSVPLNAISRVIGRGGSNINAIRGATGAHIEVEKQCKGQGERNIFIKGTPDVTKQAATLIAALIKDPDVDILQMLPKTNKPIASTTTLWDKTQIGTKKVTGKVLTVTQPSATVPTPSKILQSVASSAPPSASRSPASLSTLLSTSVKVRNPIQSVVASRVTAPRLIAQAEKNALAAAAAAAASNQTSIQTRSSLPSSVSSSTSSATMNRLPSSSSTIGGGASKLITTLASQTFAAKLSETTAGISQLSVSVSQQQQQQQQQQQSSTVNSSNIMSSAIKTQQRQYGLPSSNLIGPISPQQQHNNSSQQQQQLHQQQQQQLGSPKHSGRPTPTASAPPNMQHYHQSPGKSQIFGNSSNSLANVASSNETTGTNIGNNSNNSNIVQHNQHHQTVGGRSATPNLSNSVQLHDELNNSHHSNLTSKPSEYSLFYNAEDHSMWGRVNESHQKPVNFAAVTGGGVSGVNSGNSVATNSGKFIEEPPKVVDVSKAPGYRGGVVCSPVSSKTSSNSTTPPNISSNNSNSGSVSSSSSAGVVGSGGGVGAGNFQVFQEPSKTQPLLPIGRPQQVSSQYDIGSGGSGVSPFVNEIFKSNNIPPHNMLNISASSGSINDSHLLQSSYHPSANLKTLNYQSQQQQQQQQQPIVSMSRLNPKAPDFSSSVYNPHGNASKQQQQQQSGPLYNGYPMPTPVAPPTNQSNAIYSSTGKNSGLPNSNMDSYHRAQQQSAQNRWGLMHMPQSFTSQQSELMSGMVGMTIHHIARATGSEILENGSDLTTMINHNSPNMSPNLQGASGLNLHQDSTAHYMEDRKPQPIGTERNRKTFSSMEPARWMFETKVPPVGVTGPPSNRWPSGANDHFGLNSAQIYADDAMIMDYPAGMDASLPAVPPSFTNGPIPYLMPIGNQRPQQQHGGHNFSQMELKDHHPWEASNRSTVNDLPDKPHWTGKWNQ